MHNPDRANVLATKLLLRQPQLHLPVDPFALCCSGKVLIDSVQHFARVVGKVPQDFLCAQSGDCFAVLYRGCRIILYNGAILSQARRNWSIAHELGHLCCRHQSDGLREEGEANAFAASLLAPRIVVSEFWRRGLVRCPQDLQELFGISQQAAAFRWEELSGRMPLPASAFSDLECQLLERFLPAVEERLHEPVISLPKSRTNFAPTRL